jgi:hypothetical protein
VVRKNSITQQPVPVSPDCGRHFVFRRVPEFVLKTGAEHGRVACRRAALNRHAQNEIDDRPKDDDSLRVQNLRDFGASKLPMRCDIL